MVHDPLCVTPYKQQATCASCVLVARVRADERERVITTLIDASGIGNVIAAAATAHAEAVAARLVEVICDLDWQLGDDRVICDALIVQLQHERAEVAALRELVPVVYGMGRDDEASALPMREFDMRDPREVLADLRAKADECSTVGDVLTLIEEAGQ